MLMNIRKRTDPLPDGKFNWVPSFFAKPDTLVLQRQSLDAFFFLRFLKMCVIICLFCTAVTWPILFPVYATGGGGKKQLDIITYGNIAPSPWRQWATVLVGYLVYGGFSCIVLPSGKSYR